MLTYPNPASPLNHDAAELFEKNVEGYNKRVRECVLKYALNKEFQEVEEEMKEENDPSESSEEEGTCSLSDYNSIVSSDNEINLYWFHQILLLVDKEMHWKKDLKIETKFFEDDI